MTLAAVALGSNLGDRREHLIYAADRLADSGGLIVAVSSLYETAPVGGPEQGYYLNAVVVLETPLTPREMLELCLEIEVERGRERHEKAGPRTLDLDLLMHGDGIVSESGLVVPHPRIGERRFVLEPLVEVWGEGGIPGIPDLEAARVATADQAVELAEGPRWTMRRPRRRVTAAVAAVVAGVGVIVARAIRRRR